MGMDKIKQILTKVSKKQWSALAVIVVVVIGFVVYQSNKKVDVTKGVTVSFSGYNGTGTASYDGNVFDKNVLNAFFDKAKLSENLKRSILDSSLTSDSYATLSSSDKDKIAKIARWKSSTKGNLNKYSNLSNGDKVTLSVTSTEKDSPVKTVKKTFTVHGLKKIKNVSTKKVIDKLKFKFTGVDNKGTVAITSKAYDEDIVFNIKNNGSLKNGDKLTVDIPDELFEAEDGVRYVGKRSTTLTVSGLIDANAISNSDAVKKVTDALINDQYESGEYMTFTNTFVNMYVFKSNNVPSSGGYYSLTGNDSGDESDDESSVYLNGGSSFYNTDNTDDNFTIVALYKIAESGPSSVDGMYDDPYYVGVTVNDLKSTNGKVNIDSISTDESTEVSRFSYTDSLETIQHDFNAKGLKIR